MADEKSSSGSNGAGAVPIGTDPNAPRMNVLAQYVKDLSFENPEAPGSLTTREQPPRINISINVTANRLNATDVEVLLKLEATARDNDKALFTSELVYAGLFRFTNISEQQIGPLAMVECPRLLFPFARQVLAEATRNGGFPPLMVDPVDFAALYRDRQRQEQLAATMPSPANLS